MPPYLELLADTRVTPHDGSCHLRCSDGHGWEGDTAALGETVHQHVPPEARPLAASDDLVQGNEHFLPLYCAVHEAVV